ncbi:hypothetical protein Gotur_005084 [Gossypium turneri]
MGEEDITTSIQVLHEEDEEALSLCDLPLEYLDTKNSPTNDHLPNLKHTRTQKSSSEYDPEFFEFFSDKNGSHMCPADDLIFGGKLVPLKQQQQQYFPSQTQSHVLLRKRSESLSELRTQNRAVLLRNSRSLDYQKPKLHRSDMAERNSKPEVSSPKKVVKPRWYVFMFGSVKFPPEMELKDIKSRQFRRNPAIMFPDDGKKMGDNRSSDKGSSSWCLLKALSCRDYTSVAVTSSFYLSHAR